MKSGGFKHQNDGETMEVMNPGLVMFCGDHGLAMVWEMRFPRQNGVGKVDLLRLSNLQCSLFG